jgi:DNA invertase Pin-like site-specific DNA recombinase
MTTKAYSYLRFSTPEQALGDSERRQVENARAYAIANDLELDESLTFDDKGISAFRGKNVGKHGKLRTFLDAVKQGVIAKGSYLLVESVDRITRQNPWDALDVFREIINSEIILVTVNDRRVYSRDIMRKSLEAGIMLQLVCMRAHEESLTKSNRIKQARAAQRRKAHDGTLYSSTVPGWLRVEGRVYVDNRPTGGKCIPIPDRVQIVRRIFRMYLDGEGLDSITSALNTEGVDTWGTGERKAAHWHRSFISKVLDNPAVIGVFQTHEDTYVDGRRGREKRDAVEGYYPVVIDRETWDRVQAMRSGHKSAGKGKHTTGKLNNLFAGLLQCPKCNGSMFLRDHGVRVWNGKPYPHRSVVCYAAHSSKGVLCARTGVAYDRIEQAFLRKWKELLDTMPGGVATEDLEVELANTDGALGGALDMRDNTLAAIQRGSTPALLEQLRKTDGDIKELQEEMAKLAQQVAAASPSMVDARAQELAEVLSDEPLDRKRANARMRALLSSVVVDYDACSLSFNWQHGGESSVMYSFPKTDDKGKLVGRKART